jgi:hypothetical protein
MRQRLLSILFILMISACTAQTGLWSAASFSTRHNKKWQSELQLLQRYSPEGWSKSGIAITEHFQPKKILSFEMQYRWTAFPNDNMTQNDADWDHGNRVRLAVSLKPLRSKKDQNRFECAWRNAIQMERLTWERNPILLRIRLKLSTPQWKKVRLNTQVEYFYWLNAVQYWSDEQLIQYGLSKEWRYSADIELKINKNNQFNVGFCYNNRLLKIDRQWLTIGFHHEIKRKKESAKKNENKPTQE